MLSLRAFSPTFVAFDVKLRARGRTDAKHAPVNHRLPGRSAHVPAFRVEFLAETGAGEKAKQRNNSETSRHFHCTSSSILLGAVSSRSPRSERDRGGVSPRLPSHNPRSACFQKRKNTQAAEEKSQSHKPKMRKSPPRASLRSAPLAPVTSPTRAIVHAPSVTQVTFLPSARHKHVSSNGGADEGARSSPRTSG